VYRPTAGRDYVANIDGAWLRTVGVSILDEEKSAAVLEAFDLVDD
jgi:hypothetical protein